MRASRKRCIIAAFTLSALLLACCSRHTEEQKIPEEVGDAVFDSVFTLLRQGKISTRYELVDARDRIAAGLFSTMGIDSLSRADSLYYGRMLFWSGRDDDARAVFDYLKNTGGKEARSAFLGLINMEIERGDASVAENVMFEYREHYPPGPKNTWALYEQCEDLGGRYVDKNLLDEAIRVYVEELNSLPFYPRCQSFSLLADLTNVSQEAEKLDVCREQLLRCKKGFESSYTVYVDTVSYADSTSEADDEMPGKYEMYIRFCDKLLKRIDLIGKQAPELEFMHVFNADSSLTIGSLRGKVVILDFWTTWCGSCTMGYIELRKLYDEYKPRGFEIIGVTSLQGKYNDIETGEVEEGLEPEREVEITAEYIKNKNLIWPCAIAKESIFNNAYVISSVPTLVVIDREGRIRMIRSFVGELEQKRRMIERFL